MKMFTPEEVAEKIKKFNEYLNEEKKLQEEILNLKMYGPRDHFVEASKRHDEILREIDRLRFECMMPILEELSEFVAICFKREQEEKEQGLR